MYATKVGTKLKPKFGTVKSLSYIILWCIYILTFLGIFSGNISQSSWISNLLPNVWRVFPVYIAVYMFELIQTFAVLAVLCLKVMEELEGW